MPKTKTKTKKPPRTKKPEQTSLPGEGYARKVDPAIEQAEAELTEARTAKVGAKKEEDEAAERLVAKMREHNIDVYKFTDAEGVPVTIRVKAGKVKVTISRKKPAQADEAN
jgi:hypothetical protein